MATVAWLAMVGGGMRALWRYENTPGVPARPADGWPAGAPFVRNGATHTLVMLAHPRCPCTRASVAELRRLMTEVQGAVDAHVLFFAPADADVEWAQTDTWEGARAIPGVSVAVDVDGREAARFGAAVSGQVLLYDRAGKLQFRGGITGGRGHEGDNPGRARVVSLIRTGTADAAQSRVFGCSLLGAAPPVPVPES